MTITVLKPTVYDGNRIVVGEVVDIDETTATRWIKHGIAEAVLDEESPAKTDDGDSVPAVASETVLDEESPAKTDDGDSVPAVASETVLEEKPAEAKPAKSNK